MTRPEPTKPVRIRFCVNNPIRLAERADLIDRGYECVGCLGNCTRCFETRFLEINDKFVEGDSYQKILSQCSDRSDSCDNDSCEKQS